MKTGENDIWVIMGDRLERVSGQRIVRHIYIRRYAETVFAGRSFVWGYVERRLSDRKMV